MLHLRFVACALLFTSLALFYFGYVPISGSRRTVQDLNYFSKKTIDKVVLIVIDSLRSDMVYNRTNLWPNLMTIVNRSWTYSTIAELQPPSLSLPKIKCLVTGAVIGFIDVMFNTDSSEINQDNIIDNLIKYRNFTLNHYGDDTWIHLFPKQFKLVDSTSPFFVHDFYEVDQNVSRNIPKIINSSDSWNMVVLHYLGLDHMGHAVGPFGSVVDQKLLEMDSTISKLINGLCKKLNTERTLFIFTSDHGMSNLGGHGGSSKEELSVPLLFINKNFELTQSSEIDTVQQNDVAPALAILLGVPIPSESIGVIPLPLLSLILSFEDRWSALLSNYEQLLSIAKRNYPTIKTNLKVINDSVTNLLHSCKSYKSTICSQKFTYYCSKLIRMMKRIQLDLKYDFIQHDSLLLEVGQILAFLSFLTCIGILLLENDIHISVSGILFTISVFLLSITLIYRENMKYCFFSSFKYSVCALLIVITVHSTVGFKYILQFAISRIQNTSELLIFISYLLILLSMVCPSFIREEHLVWFFVNTSLIFLYLVKQIISKGPTEKLRFDIRTIYFSALFILFIDSLLRFLNQTGEQWSFIPDLGDLLMKEENRHILLMSVGLCLSIVGFIYFDTQFSLHSTIAIILVFICGVYKFSDIFGYTKVARVMVHVYYAILVLQLIYYLLARIYNLKHQILRPSSVLFFMSILICRQPNIILWTAVAMKTVLLRNIWLNELYRFSIFSQLLIFKIAGFVTYFQQGNSNSLTTLDVQPGFSGMSMFIPPLVFPVVAIHTFSGNLYWILVWYEWLSDIKNWMPSTVNETLVGNVSKSCKGSSDYLNNSHCNPSSRINTTTISTYYNQNRLFLDVFLYIVLISSLFSLSTFLFCNVFKHHPLSWSVYAPKLLYNIFHSGFLIIAYILFAKLFFR